MRTRGPWRRRSRQLRRRIVTRHRTATRPARTTRAFRTGSWAWTSEGGRDAQGVPAGRLHRRLPPLPPAGSKTPEHGHAAAALVGTRSVSARRGGFVSTEGPQARAHPPCFVGFGAARGGTWG